MLDNILAASILAATPLLLAAMGGMVNRLGGLINIALEGKMLAGALVAVVAAAATGSWLAGLAAAALAGAVVGAGMALAVTRLHANEIIAALGLNVLIAGLAGFYLKTVAGTSGTLRPDGLATLPQLDWPVLADIPVVGAILSGKDVLTYAAWLTVAGLAVLLVRTRWGLRLRATGAAETAAQAVGVRTRALREGATVLAGILAGLGGAHLALGQVGLFHEGMVAGRGFIAVAAMFFGRARPFSTAAACLLFALFDATQIRLQGFGFPAELVQTIPYLMVVIILATVGAIRTGQTYRRLD